ncbi:hypothetical protein H6G64_32425 [Calothrix sp. FACHB-156]|nr:hypothetical protein [Calothrix sp. FACHB-156]
MLARKTENSTSTSPFLFNGLVEKGQLSKTEHPTPEVENNRARTFRRAGNACEIAAGGCLNSAVIFTFHLLQVHPVGMFFAVGTAHLYFTATASGEQGNLLTNCMTGASASLALFCSLSEPLGEWWEAAKSKNTAQAEISEMYAPTTANYSGGLSSVAIALLIAIAFLFIASNKPSKKNHGSQR